MKRICTFLLAVLMVHNLSAGHKLKYLGISLTNSITAKPITGFPKVFYSNYHPGVCLSTGFNWKSAEKHDLSQSFKLGYFSHRFIQRSVQLYSEFGYRWRPGNRFGYTVALGGGYLHMIPAEEQFRLNDQGDWEKIKMRSRPQAMISLSLGVDYKLNQKGNHLFMRYQNLLQTPFVPGYVPLLPYNILHLGVTIPMSAFKKGGKSE